ncbi:hypothetical protein N7516_003932 [Penicillium verrucosum]|uniref:uncharacterized protein n=1 Tax=Penicillium verrucosum TaxID=60171 RepID=UPI0025451286|nr:uncharacterized protein N7516_003932 [Penicillium verrucosum]KAJ5943764.1 hypothetical protein N7516_003932 [Penicillium verrucosum]
MDSTGLSSDGAAYRSRGYQLEMLEASLKDNTIVAMDTGSGKTHIAILRIIHELENCSSPDKLIWFLTPTVALSLQQHEVITSQILSVKTKVLTGLDNVDRWTEQGVWDKVLKDVRVVVSTYAVLADALGHGFVRMSRLALIIFDEAHHCTRRHPANKIMQNHYHPSLLRSGPNAVPRILGLTASPIVRSSPNELETIESNLNAVCKTPRVYRTELLENTHRPHLERLNYMPFDEAQYGFGGQLLSSLIECCRAYNIEDDPWIESLRSKNQTVELTKALTTGKTFCSEQLNNFQARARHIYEELGGWAADFFISASIDQLQCSIQDASEMSHLDQMERIYLLELLLAMPAPVSAEESSHISIKLEVLLNFLERMDRPGFSGLLFAKQRATVSVLARILSLHPKTRDRFQCASYVGWSSDRNRKGCLGDLLHRDMQRDTLDEFKAGRKNLIVTTDVLEEGIDISACSLVICYDNPANLKSFVQRRGRARHRESTYAVMISNEDQLLSLHKWQELEHAMIKAYQDDERQRREAFELEAAEEHVKERLWVEKTNALLTADDAVQHLHHFCAVLPVDEYSDNRPMFSFQENSAGLLLGTVTLPNSVHPTVRRANGKYWWRTERAARKETAFQAYKALYSYGLINDNLLPLTRKPELRFSDQTTLPSILQVAEQYDPYVDLAQAWALGSQRSIYEHPARASGGDNRDFAALFIPDISHEHLGQWLAMYEGKEPALEVYSRNPTTAPMGIVRDQSKFSEPRTFNKWIVPAQVTKASPIEVECSSFPRRRNLLQVRTMNVTDDGETDAPKKSYVLPAAACVIDKLPAKQGLFGLFISAILDRLEASLVAHRLNDTILKGVGIENIDHVITAISAPIAQASTNYQRFEFFGDSVLKFTVSCQLFFRNTNWHEGYLSESRDKHIQNNRLARAALDTGIDCFILTNRFTPRKWTVPLIRNKLEPSTAKRNISIKVLADVVESLIGAAYVDGGIRKAQACLHRFLPEIDLFTNEISPLILPPGKGVSNLINHHRLAGLIGYTFKDPALLTEALTHASCEYDTSTQSYQRLEFLGDAVLDMVVMAVIAAHPVEMDQGPMTLLKHSVVNGNLLAFFCMELCAPDEPSHMTQCANGEVSLIPHYDEIHLWRFLRSHGPNIKAAREACLERHQGLHIEIRDALEHGSQYPWELFARLRADKFLSDIIESVLGAIFIDCGGNLDVCHAFVERIGLVWYIQRVIADGVNVVHPRNIAQNMVKGAGTLVFKRKRVESGGTATYRCSAVVNQTEIALVEGCASAEEAEVKVANVAIEHLTLHPLA